MNCDDEFTALFDLPMFDNVRPLAPKATTTDRLTQSFEEVNAFYEANNREPSLDGPFDEKTLAHKLLGIRKNERNCKLMLPYDKFNLLDKPSVKTVDEEFEDILNNPYLNISKEDLSIFDVPKHLIKKQERSEADFVAQREKCEDFHLYEDSFKKVHKELNEGKRSLVKFNTQSLKEGTYYVVSGVVVLLEKILELRKDKGHYDGRTRCIYENGTESNIFLDTLRKAVYADGFVITENADADEQAFQNNFAIVKEDVQDGWIYVLRSLSKEPAISSQKNLYKIGFSTVPVEERIKNPEQEPTYLMDKVAIVSTWKTFNMKTHEFENIIHQFFSTAMFHIKVQDSNGIIFTPREWFVVPLGIIESAIKKIIDKSIVNYHYNRNLEALEELPQKEERVKSEKIDTTDWSILTLNIKQIYFNEILSGEKTIEYRDLKQSKMNAYTWVDNNDGKRYLRQFNALQGRRIKNFAPIKVHRGTLDPIRLLFFFL
ncbi:GIY-YIG nuclease family protein [uncultured Bacteroides sp.]|uniref:GIY-YIG nuclease family protein n=1 Tax=uncultured Bacteroides sp. TaxID=162156 RepID=UPI002AA81A98|nr:GIY-YIG nuclease family protein [uncultured Bacteroides sp.]